MSGEKSPHACQLCGYVPPRNEKTTRLAGCEWCITEEHCSRCAAQSERTLPVVPAVVAGAPGAVR
jgi:hypothetical protein